MSFNVTQCPACESTFNTNSRVLAAAAGRVRCGACLNVFEAIDNFLIPEEVGATQNQDESVFVGNNPQEYFDPASFLTRSALNETASDEADQAALIDEQSLHQTLEQSETVNEEFFTTVAQELQGIEETSTQEPLPADEEQQIDQPEERQLSTANESIDEEFEDEILDSFMAEETDAHEATVNDTADSAPEEGTEVEPALTTAEDTHTPSTESFIGTGLSISYTFDPYAHLETRTKEPKSETSPDREIENTESAPTAESTETLESIVEAASTSVTEDEEPIAEELQVEEAEAQEPQQPAPEIDEDSTEAIRSRALEAELSDEEALEAIPLENLAALGSMSTPVEFLARRESRLLRSTLLFLSILLFGGLLSAQYLWQRMELYSQLPQLRPLYEAACTYLSCTLPEYTDIDSIRSENLTVQTHPTFANGLMVNTVIRNTASFKQAFPILIFSFNSAENNLIALREFTPAEYLDPGLRSIQAMPANTPVQISLAIMDPGAEAVNYTLAFRWP